MKTKKNLIWLVVSLLVISIVLAGCSNNAGSSGEGGNKSEENWQLSIHGKYGGAFSCRAGDSQPCYKVC